MTRTSLQRVTNTDKRGQNKHRGRATGGHRAKEVLATRSVRRVTDCSSQLIKESCLWLTSRVYNTHLPTSPRWCSFPPLLGLALAAGLLQETQAEEEQAAYSPDGEGYRHRL